MVKIERKKNYKNYLTNYNSSLQEDLEQAHYQILLKILLNKFIKQYKYGSDIKSEMCGIKYKDYKSCLEYKNTKELKTNLIEWKCFYCNKNYQNKFDDPHYPKKFCSLVH